MPERWRADFRLGARPRSSPAGTRRETRPGRVDAFFVFGYVPGPARSCAGSANSLPATCCAGTRQRALLRAALLVDRRRRRLTLTRAPSRVRAADRRLLEARSAAA